MVNKSNNYWGERVFPEIGEILSTYTFTDGKLKNTTDATRLKNEIKKRFPSWYENPLFAFLYFRKASQQKRKEETYLYDLFHEELNKFEGGKKLAMLVLQDHKLDDLIMLDITYNKSKNINKWFTIKPKTPFDNQFITNILSFGSLDRPLLIVGQTGTSKEGIARSIHKLSKRYEKPYITVNCAAIPDTLFESEFFGYVKGAHSEAKKDKRGYFEITNGGTIFLDEIGKMPLYQQAKILRVIEDQKCYRLGSEEPINLDIRIIAACQPNDIDDRKRPKLLPDLKYRLRYPDVFKMPTLNERLNMCREDSGNYIINNSLNIILEKDGMREHIDQTKISAASLKLLLSKTYIGNYRELESILSSGVRHALIDNRKEILPEDLSILDEIEPYKETPMQEDYTNVKLKDVFHIFDDKIKPIVETKIKEVFNTGKDIKNVLHSQGLPNKEYQAFRQKVIKITRKKFTELKKEVSLQQQSEGKHSK